MVRIPRNLKPRALDSSGGQGDDGIGDGDHDYFDGTAGELPVVKPQNAGKGKSTKKAKKALAKSGGTVRRSVTMGVPHKKLTKKAKQSLLVWRGEQYGKARDALIAGHLVAARKKFGHTA